MARSVELYGPAIQDAVVKGDLKQMKTLASSTERLLEQTGTLSAALALLKLEIAKLEFGKKKK